MALKAASFPLIFTATQGAADAYVQAAGLTGLTGNQAYNLLGIGIEQTTAIASANVAEYEVALCRRSKAAMPLLSDPDVIWKFRWQQLFVTSGSWVRDKGFYWKPDLEVALVEEQLYLCVDTAATAIVNTFVMRLDVELDTMSPIDRLNLITRSLT